MTEQGEYNAGWRAGKAGNPDSVTRADNRHAPKAWYLGFYDAEGGKPKYDSWKPPTVRVRRLNNHE